MAEGIDAAVPLQGFELDVDYASGVLQPGALTGGGLLGSSVFTLENSAGLSSLAFAEVALGGGGAQGSGAVVRIELTAIGEGSTELALRDVLAASPSGQPIPVTVEGPATVVVDAAVSPADIPTLSEWALLVFVLLLALLALSRMKLSARGAVLLVVLLLPAAAAEAQAPGPDVTGDGVVDILDAAITGGCFGADLGTRTECVPADVDGDGSVDLEDLEVVADFFGGPPPPGTGGPPVADAGSDQNGRLGQVVFLSGARSTDPDGDPLAFAWTVTASPPGSSPTLEGASAVVAELTGETPGSYEITLEVSDGTGTDRDSTRVLLDLDGDGVPGGDDPDRDGDGIPDSEDVFPDDSGEFVDSDGDGVGNLAQEDEDGDGVLDPADELPFDPSLSSYPETAEQEFNDNPGDADPIGSPVPFRVTGAIGQDLDGDYFRFAAVADRLLTATLTIDGAGFEPVLSFLDAQGNRLPSVRPDLSPGTAVSQALSMAVPAGGDLFLVVGDRRSRGAPGFTYRIEVFEDRDLDALDDARELALGLNPEASDADLDGVFDAAELAAALATGGFLPDPDGDGTPNWFDPESDGDGVPDLLEGSDDPDGDGLGAFADTDADGNGLGDRQEVGPDPLRPLDADLDGRPDFRDGDDDGDTLLDAFDPDRLQPAPVSDALDLEDRVFVDRARIEVGPGSVDGVVRPGDLLILEGDGFAPDPDGNLVVFTTGVDPRNLVPAAADPSELRVVVPDGLPDETTIAVFAGGKLSNRVTLTRLPPQAPLLLAPEVPEAAIGETLTLEGANLVGDLQVSFGGTLAPVEEADGDFLQVVVPSDAVSGAVTARNAAGESNAVSLKVSRGVTVQVVPPAGSAVAPDDLLLSFGLLGEAVPDAAGTAEVAVAATSPDLVFALLPETAGEREAVFLEVLVLPGDTAVTVDAESTVLALVFEILGLRDLLDTPSLRQARDDSLTLPEIEAAAVALAGRLADDPRFLTAPDAAFGELMAEALLAVDALVEEGLGNGSLSAPARSVPVLRAAASTRTPPEITPADEQDGIRVFQPDELLEAGNVAVENDTQLYLSASFLDARSGAVLSPHVSDFLDTEMVGPQGGGLLFLAGVKDDFDQCGFRDCIAEIVTAGGTPPRGAPPVARYLVLRTAVERGFLPIVKPLIGNAFDERHLVRALLQESPSVVATALALAQAGNAAEAAEVIVDHLEDDMLSLPPGPITQAVGRAVGRNVAQVIAERIAAKLGIKFVPVANIISLVNDALEALSNGANFAAALDDLAEVRGRLEFDVDYPFEVTGLEPTQVERGGATVTLAISGQGFAPLRESPTSSVLPVVTLVDEGRGEVLEDDRPVPGDDGTKLFLFLPASFLREAVGPISVRVEHQGESVEASEPIEVVGGPTIDSLDPASGRSGTIVTLRGFGFSRDDAANEVTFAGTSGRERATVLLATETLLRVIAPPFVATGPVTVEVNGEVSNGVPFTADGGTVAISFGDNGNFNDDTYALSVDGQLIHASPTPTRRAGPFLLDLAPGTHTVALRGITVPDNTGTYFIEFSGNVTAIDGPPLTGNDLTGGVEKRWTIEVGPAAPGSGQLVAPSRPVEILWQEGA